MIMSDEETVKLCPNCGSTDIIMASQPAGSNLGGGNQFYCNNCFYGHFQHVLFKEVRKQDIKKVQAEIKKGKRQ